MTMLRSGGWILLVWLAAPAAAQDVGPFDQLVGLVEPGDGVRVTFSGGREGRARVVAVTPETLSVVTHGQHLDLGEEDVWFIHRRVRDPTRRLGRSDRERGRTLAADPQPRLERDAAADPRPPRRRRLAQLLNRGSSDRRPWQPFGLADDGRPRFDAWLDQPPHAALPQPWPLAQVPSLGTGEPVCHGSRPVRPQVRHRFCSPPVSRSQAARAATGPLMRTFLGEVRPAPVRCAGGGAGGRTGFRSSPPATFERDHSTR